MTDRKLFPEFVRYRSAKEVTLEAVKHPSYTMITVLGHTAAGKTAFAARLAAGVGGEIISADSRQVYRGMDIGTGKDYSDYLVDGKSVPHHLVDIAEAGTEYNVYRFRNDFFRAYDAIKGRGRIPVLCGGSGLYIESVLRNYRMLSVPVDPGLRKELEKKDSSELEEILRSYGPLHNRTDTESRKRLVRAVEIAMYQDRNPGFSDGKRDGAVEDDRDLHSLVLGIRFSRNARRERITRRLRMRLEQGMVEEAGRLLAEGVPAEMLEYYGLEYRYLVRFIRGELSYEEMVTGLTTAIHRFAKRQMTYFRGMERRGIPIHWLDGEWSMEEKTGRAMKLYENRETT